MSGIVGLGHTSDYRMIEPLLSLKVYWYVIFLGDVKFWFSLCV